VSAGAVHPWRLVAPWYRWERQQRELGLAPRDSRPVFQKFATTDFANVFLKDPQRSLKFNADDVVWDAVEVPLLRRFGWVRIGTTWAWRKLRLSDHERVRTDLRKLFLDVHRRAYLVVCSLHCDVRGLPPAARDEVCEAGFVVRRRSLRFAADRAAEAATLIQSLRAAAAHLATLERRGPDPRPRRGPGRLARTMAAVAMDRARRAAIDEARAQVRQRREAIAALTGSGALRVVSEGWVRGELDHVGSWVPVDDAPPTLEEVTIPLFPLAAPPDDPDHSAQGATLFFGVVPTGSADHDGDGAPRFDDAATYEIRCFVRRRRPECRNERRGACHGPITWSLPTEPYRLAAFHDLTGNSQRTIRVTMPSLPSLGSEVGDFGRLRGLASVNISTPTGSMLNVGGGIPPVPGIPPIGGPGGLQIATPLVTIVAMVLLQVFLPIIVSIFQLWYLLPLRFSLPSLPTPSLGDLLGAEGAARILADYDPAIADGLLAALTAPVPTDALEFEDRVYRSRPAPGETRALAMVLRTFAAAVPVGDLATVLETTAEASP